MNRTQQTQHVAQQMRQRERQPVIEMPADANRLADLDGWINRYEIRSTDGKRLYVVSQNERNRHWGCTCKGYTLHQKRDCKHLREMGIPGAERPYEATVIQHGQRGATTGARPAGGEFTSSLPPQSEPETPAWQVQSGRALAAEGEV